VTSVAALVGPVATALGVAGASTGFLATALASGVAAEGWIRWALVALALAAA